LIRAAAGAAKGLLWLARLALGKLKGLGGTLGTQRPQGDPPWLLAARREIGFRERGRNLGIEDYIELGHCGALGDPWCAIFVNAMLESVRVKGSRSPGARSFERHPAFVRLPGPARGAIVTMTRGGGWQGHVFFYTGHSPAGVVGIGGNEDDGVREVPHDEGRITGYWWPKQFRKPKVGRIAVANTARKSIKEA
jgi:uncharacterized protein (TIGR02594 family)